jgi:predicted HTH domain antitoxin
MNKLAVTVPFSSGESFASFCSRLAEANNSGSLQTFCSDLGIPHRSVRLGLECAVSAIGTLADTDQELLRSGLATRTEAGYLINGEILTGVHYIRSAIRYCPHCLREDLNRIAGPASSRPYGRLAWNIGFIRSCEAHGVLLSCAHKTIGIDLRDDFSRIWNGLPPHERECEPPAAETTAFERYVLKRASGRAEGSGWVDMLPLYVVGHLSDIVGAVITHGRAFRSTDLDALDWLTAGQTGFDVLRSGQDAFGDFLRSMQEGFLAKNRNDYAGPALYGTLFRRLEQQIDDPNFDGIRELIRKTAIETLPFGPDDLLFGKLDMPRKLHSIQTASKQSGIRVKRLRRQLVHEGLIEKKDMRRPAHRVFVDAEAMEAVLAAMSDPDGSGLTSALVPEEEAMHIFDVSRDKWQAIATAFGLRNQAYARVGRTDLADFLDRLRSSATVKTCSNGTLKDVVSAIGPIGFGVVELLQLVLSRSLKVVSVDEHAIGLRQILIDPTEAEAILLADFKRLYMLQEEVAHVLQIDTDSVTRMAKSGALKRKRAEGRFRHAYLRTDISDFQRTYVSLSRAAAEAGLHSVGMAKLLRERGLTPEIGGKGEGAFFFRISSLEGVVDPQVLDRLRSGEL